jgi:hypothetical protein
VKKVIAILTLLLLVNATLALADGPLIFGAKEPIGEAPSRDAFHCQPLNPYFNVHQASTGFGSEFADDIPSEYMGTVISEVSLYVGEFYGDWIDPDGVVLNFYNSECLPSLEPDVTFYFPWADIHKEMVYDGSWRVYLVSLTLPQELVVQSEMSLGAFVDNNWGGAEPFCGVGITDYDDVYGACDGAVDAVDWGYPRWTSSSHYTGMGLDLAYCLTTGTVATDEKTWGTLKSFYR